MALYCFLEFLAVSAAFFVGLAALLEDAVFFAVFFLVDLGCGSASSDSEDFDPKNPRISEVFPSFAALAPCSSQG